MGKRDSEDDIRYYLPDLATILKRADPARSDKNYREAMDNPELDAALAERRQRLGEDDGMTIPGPAAANGAVSMPEAQPARVSAPSPWAKAANELAIDKAALPSATAPKPEGPDAAPQMTAPRAEATRPKRRRALPKWVFPGIAAIALAPLAMWAVVSKLPPRQALSVSSAAASARAAEPADVDGGPAPSSQSSAPAPSAVPTDAPPAATSAIPSTPAPPPSPRQPGQKPRGAGEDPYGDASVPAPTKTAVPAPSNSAAVTPAAPSAPSKAAPPAASSGPQAPPILRPRDE
jgi:hypothetical protein